MKKPKLYTVQNKLTLFYGSRCTITTTKYYYNYNYYSVSFSLANSHGSHRLGRINMHLEYDSK